MTMTMTRNGAQLRGVWGCNRMRGVISNATDLLSPLLSVFSLTDGTAWLLVAMPYCYAVALLKTAGEREIITLDRQREKYKKKSRWLSSLFFFILLTQCDAM